MAIVAYAGLPGDGKSYSVVEHVILPALKAHRVVVTNLAMNMEEVKKDFPGADLRIFNAQDLADKPGDVDELWPPGSVVVVDEAWQLFPAGITAKEAPAALKKLLNEHRHRVNMDGDSMQIVLIALDLAGIAPYARQLVAETYRMQKLRSLGSSKRFRVDVYQGAVTGMNPSKSRRIREIFGKYDAAVYRFYKSHTQSKAALGGANEATVDRRGVIWRSPVVYLGGPAVLLLLVWALMTTWRFFHPAKPVRAETVASAAGTGAPTSRGVVQGQVNSGPSWRISLVAEGGGIDRVWLQRGRRYVSLPIDPYCDKDADGFYACQFEGQRVTNRVRELPEALPEAPGVGNLLPVSNPIAAL